MYNIQSSIHTVHICASSTLENEGWSKFQTTFRIYHVDFPVISIYIIQYLSIHTKQLSMCRDVQERYVEWSVLSQSVDMIFLIVVFRRDSRYPRIWPYWVSPSKQGGMKQAGICCQKQRKVSYPYLVLQPPQQFTSKCSPLHQTDKTTTQSPSKCSPLLITRAVNQHNSVLQTVLVCLLGSY